MTLIYAHTKQGYTWIEQYLNVRDQYVQDLQAELLIVLLSVDSAV